MARVVAQGGQAEPGMTEPSTHLLFPPEMGNSAGRGGKTVISSDCKSCAACEGHAACDLQTTHKYIVSQSDHSFAVLDVVGGLEGDMEVP